MKAKKIYYIHSNDKVYELRKRGNKIRVYLHPQPSEEFVGELARDMNRIMETEKIWEWQGIDYLKHALPSQMRTWITRGPTPDERIVINRWFIEKGFLGDIAAKSHLYIGLVEGMRDLFAFDRHNLYTPDQNGSVDYVRYHTKKYRRVWWQIALLLFVLLSTGAAMLTMRTQVPSYIAPPDMISVHDDTAQDAVSVTASIENDADGKKNNVLAVVGETETVRCVVDAEITRYQFSRDGKRVAIATIDKTIHVYNTTNAQKITQQSLTFLPHLLAFNNSGRTLTAISAEREVWLWDLLLQKQIGEVWQSEGVEFATTVNALKVNTQKIWATGEQVILVSDDHGKSWGYYETEAQLHDVYTYEDQVWCVGEDGVILYSRDGEYWQQQRSRTFVHLYAIAGNKQRLWAVGERGVILHSSDGKTWREQAKISDENLHAITVTANGESIWIAADNGMIVYSVDSGASWQKRFVGPREKLQAVSCSNDGSNVWIAGTNGRFICSDDRGKTWTHSYLSGKEHIHAIASDGDRQVWCAGTKGVLYYSSDAGNTWALRIANTKRNIHCAQFANNKLWLSGESNVSEMSGFPTAIRNVSVGDDAIYITTDHTYRIALDNFGDNFSHSQAQKITEGQALVAWSPRDRDVTAIYQQGQITLWRWGKKRRSWSCDPQTSLLRFCEGKLVSATQTGLIQIWDTANGKEAESWDVKTPVNNICIIDDIVYAQRKYDGVVLMRDRDKNTQQLPTAEQQSMQQSPGLTWCSAGVLYLADAKVRLWGAAEDEEDDWGDEVESTPEVQKEFADDATTIASDGENQLATLDNDNTLRIWNITTGEEIAFKQLSSSVNNLHFIDNKRLLYAGENTIGLWHITAEKPLGKATPRIAQLQHAIDAPQNVIVEREFTCELQVVNNGKISAHDVEVICTLPTGIELVSGAQKTTDSYRITWGKTANIFTRTVAGKSEEKYTFQLRATTTGEKRIGTLLRAAGEELTTQQLNINISKAAPQGWENSLWELCWNAQEEYIDFTVEEWGALSHEKQVELARSYQEWYAQEKGLELTKEMARSGAKFVLKMIPPGKFWMGSPQGEKDREYVEVRHKVWVSEVYYVGETEVTQGQWSAVMGSNPSVFKDVGLQGPVEDVSWNDCQEFCGKVGMRLLTEAEWEYACRAGTTRAYNLGDSIDTDRVNYNGDYLYRGKKGECRETTTVVKSLPNENSWGCYDFHGNVWEWCSDWYGDYSVAEQKDPKGSPQGSFRVCRGCNWNDAAWFCRSAVRSGNWPDHRNGNLGLRLCVSGAKVK
ncbi:SUMF1/EgtB/PvdO family nonheme iron enzyme [Candidatus Uabimicrobium amorphum]|uniref:Uncharacterized protein n=1 Tax=Uabimicrobium amorphum TaxID=2596890 RepID=A0A5S9IRP5_UABAM|nr:SUMF1/EgtB/PvdO family nonheme iron enzyme [Candidatus Uabimicrobium amorphum]BBM86212.1 hypothetical protein UABAM_04598 [Candidatus Uabimicrobium amorphum]